MTDRSHTKLGGKLLRHPVHFCSLGFGSGCSPWAPGTAGSLVGLALYVLLLRSFAPRDYLLAVGAFIGIGVYICGYTARALRAHDHPGIVWDEIAGYLVAMAAGPSTGWWPLLGFALFRLFDILKPWPIHMIDARVPGGLGIMLDDVAAGLFALIIVQLFAYLL